MDRQGRRLIRGIVWCQDRIVFVECQARYCGSTKPSGKRPLLLQSTAKIVWKTDKKKTSQGFDCRVVCTKRKVVTTNKTTSTTMTTMTTTTTQQTIANTKTTPTTTTPGPCVVVEGPGQGKACQFPFLWKYTNQVYDGCTFDPTRDVAPWCSTKVTLHESVLSHTADCCRW